MNDQDIIDILNNRTAELPMLEAPDESIFARVDDFIKAKEEKSVAANYYSAPVATTSVYSAPSYSTQKSYNSSSYSFGGYGQTATTTSSIVNKEFLELKKLAEESVSKAPKKKEQAVCPRVLAMQGKRNQGIKSYFGPGTFGRKALIVGGIVASKAAAFYLYELKKGAK